MVAVHWVCSDVKGALCRAGELDLSFPHSRPFQASQALSGAKLELIYSMSLAPKLLWLRARRQRLQQFQTVLWLQTASPWMSPHAHNGCLLCVCILSPIPQEICSLPPEEASIFVYMSAPEIFFFL